MRLVSGDLAKSWDSTLSALYAGVCAEPADRTAKLVFAGYCEESADPDLNDWARLVQLQLEESSLPPDPVLVRTSSSDPLKVWASGRFHVGQQVDVEQQVDTGVHPPVSTWHRGLRVDRTQPADYSGDVVQLTLVRGPAGEQPVAERRQQLKGAARSLLSAQGLARFMHPKGPLPAQLLGTWEFRDGFLSEVTCAYMGWCELVDTVPNLLQMVPVHTVRLTAAPRLVVAAPHSATGRVDCTLSGPGPSWHHSLPEGVIQSTSRASVCQVLLRHRWPTVVNWVVPGGW